MNGFITHFAPNGEVMHTDSWEQRIYAGVLGKLIGVYLGRPVEGWSYQALRERFGTVDYFVNEQLGMPLIVPDDDLSGTFAFFHALRDHGYSHALSAQQIGNSWLNYVIEEKTILWWGGLSRSTEHTAYLRLKAGVLAPDSGSIRLNGRSMAEQIGAQIFIDSWAMACPDDPELAVRLARQAASVSHDGIAVEAACLLAAMEAISFTERDLATILTRALTLVPDPTLRLLVAQLLERCETASDWREVRDWIETHHGYARYPGNCPVVTNHLAVLTALYFGGDDFQRSIAIAASAGWDTDCNAGNVGCLNGIRLGLAGIEGGADFRTAVADRLYVVTADGGACITDAVQIAREIIGAAHRLRDEALPARAPRFGFEFPGSVQGFSAHRGPEQQQAVWAVDNTGNGLTVHYRGLAPGVPGSVAVQTFTDREPTGVKGTSYFEVLASPSLYPTQTICCTVELPEDPPELALYVDHFDADDRVQTLEGPFLSLTAGRHNLSWMVPDTGGLPIYRAGLRLRSERRRDGQLHLRTMDWSGAPAGYIMGKALDMTPWLTPWTTVTTWMQSFVSSARHVAPDSVHTLSISHTEAGGVVTTGTLDWTDYRVRSRLTLSQQRAAGLVARACGHRRYYAARLTEGQAQLVCQQDDRTQVLAAASYAYHIDGTYQLDFELMGTTLRFSLDGELLLTTSDATYASGGAGFVVDEGAIIVDGFAVQALPQPLDPVRAVPEAGHA